MGLTELGTLVGHGWENCIGCTDVGVGKIDQIACSGQIGQLSW